MSVILDYYPPYYQQWLFEVLDIRPGEEAEPAMLAPLFHFNQQWVDADTYVVPNPHTSADGKWDYFDNDALLRSYTAYYMTLNMPKLWFILDRCPDLRSDMVTRDNVSVADFGAGPGTLSWAWLFYLHRRQPGLLQRVRTMHLIERNANAAELAGTLANALQRYKPFSHIDITVTVDKWQAHMSTHRDITLFGNVLVEGDTAADLNLATLNSGHVILVEPGNRRGFSRMLTMRNHLIDHGWSIQFPCPSAHACPMASTNWCHFHVNRFVLPFIQRMSAKAARHNPKHHFCGLVMSRANTPQPPDNWRVLSTVRKAGRSAIRYLCNGEHLIETVLNRRDKTDENRAFADAVPGDAGHLELTVSAAEFLSRGSIKKEDKFTIVQP